MSKVFPIMLFIYVCVCDFYFFLHFAIFLFNISCYFLTYGKACHYTNVLSILMFFPMLLMPWQGKMMMLVRHLSKPCESTSSEGNPPAPPPWSWRGRYLLSTQQLGSPTPQGSSRLMLWNFSKERTVPAARGAVSSGT